MREALIVALFGFLSAVAVYAMLAFLRIRRKGEKGTVFLPKIVLIIGMISSLLMLSLALWTAFSGKELWVCVEFAALFLLASSLIIAQLNCRVFYDQDSFTVQNFFGVRRTYAYGDITAIRKGHTDTYLYVGKRRVTVEALRVGGKEFLAFARKQYRILHDGNAIPKKTKVRFDLFNGHIDNPTEFLVVYILGEVLVVLALIAALIYTFAPVSTKNAEQMQVCLQYFGRDEKDKQLVLMEEGGTLYYVPNIIDESSYKESIKEVCDGDTPLDIYAKKYTPEDRAAYYVIQSVQVEGREILSIADVQRMHRQEYIPLVIVAAVFTVLWSAIICLSIIVGRNPNKYGKQVVRLFFKDGYVKYDLEKQKVYRMKKGG